MQNPVTKLKNDFDRFSHATSQEWEEAGRANALKLFHQAAERVPAYGKFLQEHAIQAEDIQTYADFQRVPLATKANYLKKYPLDELCWDGQIAAADTVSVSSGSTGEPSFWPHGTYLAEMGRWHYELAFRYQFQADTKKTLVVVLYTLGTWMAGTHTVEALTSLGKDGYPITVVSAGINKVEALKSIKNLAPYYEQVVMIGYPPFVKDVIDEGIREGVDWKSLNIKMMYGGEPFSEPWRDYVLEKVGSDNPLLDAANVYAAADSGIMAIETPTSIAVHRKAADDLDYSASLFGSSRVPTLQQYQPELRFFETDDDELVLTTDNTIPLIRYSLGDTGGIFSFDEWVAQSGEAEVEELLKHVEMSGYKCTLPFVYVFGRAHNTATLYALNVYPENVRAATEDARTRTHLSGKVRLATELDGQMDQYLHITMELAPGAEATKQIEATVNEVVIEKLRLLNAEYNRLVEAIGERAYPVISLVPHGDPAFRPGAKMAKAVVKNG